MNPTLDPAEFQASAAGVLRVKNSAGSIFKRQGKVYTEIVPDTKKKTLQRIIRGKISTAKQYPQRWLAQL